MSTEMHCLKTGVRWSQRDKIATNRTIHVYKYLNTFGVTKDMFYMKE